MGPGCCFLQAAFLTPKCLCVIEGSRECAKCLPPPRLLHSSPQTALASCSAAPAHPGLPPRQGRSEHSASFITRECSQSPYLGLRADTSPLPGREPGQGRPEGPHELAWGAEALPQQAGNTPHSGWTRVCHM